MAKFSSALLVIILLWSFHANCQVARRYKLPPGIQMDDISASSIIVRLKGDGLTNARLSNSSSFDIATLVERNGAAGFENIIKSSQNESGRIKKHPLAGIYKIQLHPGQNPVEVVNRFLEYPEVLYAEPYFLHKPLFVPSDPESKTNKIQGPYLSLIKAYEAWDLSRSDTTMIVAVLDTGTKLNHEDLEDNLWINYSDPVNGVDDDNDGLVDNYFGYDFADDDNDPAADIDGHGAGVAGISNASTNNGLGIAGIGFNSRYMPLKIFKSENNSFFKGYEAIIFAADKGAKIINLSWGSQGSFSQFGQDAINYAVLEKDAVIVAAAGNTDGELDFYPASFDNVLSVGATNNDDEKTSFATYSYKIDLVAPGKDIYTTTSDGGYGSDQGTSYSSPLVAGAAALLRSYSPELNAKQVMEKLRITADDIYDIPANLPYYGLLGNGRLNILAAITDNIYPAVRFESIVYDNKNGSNAYNFDTLTISGEFVNFLKPTPNLKITLSSESPYVTIIDPIFLAGSMETLDSVSVENSPFQVVLAADTPTETQLVFRLDYKDGFYEDFQYFEIITSPDYTTVNNGLLSTTISGNGNLGYNRDNYNEGVGFTFQGENLLKSMGLILATEDTLQVSNGALTVQNLNERDKDFEANVHIRYFNSSVADIDTRSSFEEVDTIPNPIGIKVDQKLISADTSDGNFLIIEYRFINESVSMIDTLYASLLADWNIADFDKNIAGWSAEDSMGYVYYPDADSLYAGIALITKQAPIHTASFVSDFGDTLSRSLKHALISNGITNTGAGSLDNEDNVAHFVGGQIFDLEQIAPQTVAFALTAGRSFQEIQINIDSARSFYTFYKSRPPLEYVTFTCEGDSALVDPPGILYDFYADIEKTTLIYSGESFYTDPVVDPIFFYAVNKDEPYESELITMKAEVRSPETDFTFQPDTVFIDESLNNHAHFQDLSKNAVLWNWDFGNGFNSTIRNPSSSFDAPGEYEVKLYVENDIGCVDSTGKPIKVLQRSAKPQITPVLICKGDSVSIDPANSSITRIYIDMELNNLIFEGDVFVSGAISSDSSFYITSMDNGIESLPVEAIINITDLNPDFSISLDTSNFDIKYLLKLKNSSSSAQSYEWKLDEVTFSTAQDTLLNYEGLSTFEITLVASDTLGCVLERIQFITPTGSQTPVISNPEPVCKYESVILDPSGGETFFFYLDGDLDSLIHKGSKLTLDSLESSINVFVIAMDSLFDSDTVDIPITVSGLTADFTMSPDSLNLTEGNDVQFQALDAEATSWFWDFDNGTTDSIASPLSSFVDPGDYMIFLRTKDAINCISVNELRLPVVSIVSLVESLDDRFLIYPNPNAGEFNISFRKPVYGKARLAIYNSTGLRIFSKELVVDDPQFNLDLPIIADGLYYLQIEMNNQISTRKLIIK